MTATLAPPDVEFAPFPKLARLNREFIITEKIDGTNAQVFIDDEGGVRAGSRKRWITPSDDNFGFAKWVAEHAYELAELLGPGRHFGEWWGSGIQRGYGLGADGQQTRRFSLFNTSRWADVDLSAVPGLRTVPVLDHASVLEGMEWYQANDLTLHVRSALSYLRTSGSRAEPGYMNPEGIVLWHVAANQGFKVTIENDGTPKSRVSS